MLTHHKYSKIVELTHGHKLTGSCFIYAKTPLTRTKYTIFRNKSVFSPVILVMLCWKLPQLHVLNSMLNSRNEHRITTLSAQVLRQVPVCSLAGCVERASMAYTYDGRRGGVCRRHEPRHRPPSRSGGRARCVFYREVQLRANVWVGGAPLLHSSGRVHAGTRQS